MTKNYLWIHRPNSLSYPWCHQVWRRLLHCYLACCQGGHLGEVPGQAYISGCSTVTTPPILGGNCRQADYPVKVQVQLSDQRGRLPRVSAGIVGRVIKEVNLLSSIKCKIWNMCSNCKVKTVEVNVKISFLQERISNIPNHDIILHPRIWQFSLNRFLL